MPALAVEILLSALILGPLVTELSVRSYFHAWEFYRYFTNVFGYIQMRLPGVFDGNPYARIVNISLWTVPYELECYLVLTIAYMVGLVRRRMWFVIVVGALTLAGTAEAFSSFDPYWVANRPLGRALVVAFLAGVAISLYAEKIRLSPAVAAACLVTSLLLFSDYRLIYLAAPPMAYVTVYLGMMNPPKTALLRSGDYSYGLYIFAFPIQQTLTMTGLDRGFWALNAVQTVILGLCYACFSWWCVEKPVLSRKADILRVVDQTIGRAGRRVFG